MEPVLPPEQLPVITSFRHPLQRVRLLQPSVREGYDTVRGLLLVVSCERVSRTVLDTGEGVTVTVGTPYREHQGTGLRHPSPEDY